MFFAKLNKELSYQFLFHVNPGGDGTMMKKHFLVALLLTLFTYSPATIHTAISMKIFNGFPQQDFKNNLDTFLQDERVQAFLNCPKPSLILSTSAGRALSNEQKDFWVQENSRRLQAFQQNIVPTLAGVAEEYKVELLDNQEHFLVQFKQYPEYLLKILKYEWPLRYQNISRVFYSAQISSIIEANRLQYVRPVQKALHHVPGRPIEITDSNYIVVTECFELPDQATNMQRFQNLSQPMLSDIMHIILYAGLWSINQNNFFILDNNQAVFCNTELPGLGGYDENDFFFRNPQQVLRNGQSGLDELAKLLENAR